MSAGAFVNQMSDAHIIVLSTCPQDMADDLSGKIVGARLAACVNSVPKVRSTYLWEGKIQTDDEALLIIKTTQDCFERLKSRMIEWHPYELPEIIAVNLHSGHAPYLDWITQCTQPATPPSR